MLEKIVKDILAAKVYDVAIQSPLELAASISDRLGNNVWLKREDLQSIFSFKLRGAYNKMHSLTEDERKQGVIAVSAGNHAQGVALAAKRLKIKATIVMPKTTPAIKVKKVQKLGAKVVLIGDTVADTHQPAKDLAEAENLIFIHPYDDPLVIAGQGTVAMEILNQSKEFVDAIFVPVGGGGLAAGVCAYVKTVSPKTKVIGVEPEDAASLHLALKEGHRASLEQVGIFADGVAVKQVGEWPYKILKNTIDDVVLVSTDEICAAIKDVFEDTRAVMEPAGAVALAGLKKYVHQHQLKNKMLVAVNSGANLNFNRLKFIAEQAEVGEEHEAILAVTIPEKPGSFKAFCHLIGKRSVTEFNYRYASHQVAHIYVGVELKEGFAEKDALITSLNEHGYQPLDLTGNELAKLHIRHMVGGKNTQVMNERLFRFEFPERPGALMTFLQNLGAHWNISLFHYRNHGAAFGRVLAGFQVPDAELNTFRESLDKLGYTYVDESENPAYRLFLG